MADSDFCDHLVLLPNFYAVKGWAIHTSLFELSLGSSELIMLRTKKRPPLSFLRFRLRSLLVFTTVLCGILGCVGYKVKQVRDQRAAVKALLAERAIMAFDYQFDPTMGGRPPGPAWARSALGDDFFAEITMVSFVVPFLSGPSSENIDDRVLQNLSSLPRLEMLNLEGCDQFTDAGLRHVSGLRHLRDLRLSETKVTDKGLDALRGLRELKHLSLEQTAVTDAGLANLASLKQLEELWLMDTAVTNACIEHLAKLTNLQKLDLDFTYLTPEGVKKLRLALPQCEIYADELESQH